MLQSCTSLSLQWSNRECVMKWGQIALHSVDWESAGSVGNWSFIYFGFRYGYHMRRSLLTVANNYTAFANTIKNHMGRFQEELSLMCQGLQKIHEIIKAVESRVRDDMEDKLSTTLREINFRTQLASANNTYKYIENWLRRNIMKIVEQWLDLLTSLAR